MRNADDNQPSDCFAIVKDVESMVGELEAMRDITRALLSSIEIAAGRMKDRGGDTTELDALVETAREKALPPDETPRGGRPRDIYVAGFRSFPK